MFGNFNTFLCWFLIGFFFFLLRDKHFDITSCELRCIKFFVHMTSTSENASHKILVGRWLLAILCCLYRMRH